MNNVGGPWAPHLLALVAAGGAAGSVLRYALGVWCTARLGTALPWGTLAVNVIGSAVIGLLGGLTTGGMLISHEVRLLLITGLLGGFTTFSAFSLDIGLLAQRSSATAALYLGGTLLLGLGAFALCFWLGRRL